MQIVRKRSKSLDFLKGDAPLLSSLKPIEGLIFFPRREGIGWDASPGFVSSCDVLANPSLPRAPALSSRVVKNASSGEWDPLLKLRIRDGVVIDGGSSFSVKDLTFPLAPVAIESASIVALKDDVVRVWDCETKCLAKSVRLPSGGDDVVTAFDVNWEGNAVAMARKGGLVSIANLETAANCYETGHPVVQAIHLERSLFSKTMFTGQFFLHSHDRFIICTICTHSVAHFDSRVCALFCFFFRRTSSCESGLLRCTLRQQIKWKGIEPKPSLCKRHL